MSSARVALILVSLACADPTATSSRPAALPATGSAQQDNSYSINGADRTVNVTVVRVRGETGEPIHAFLRRMFESADSLDARTMVVDLRSLTGSDARLVTPLVGGILRRDRFLRDGGLYVLTGSQSFSPAQNAATLLQEYARPIFVR
ncbi:MAG TPA: hypothetical protein VK565_10245 [Gemmatimonadaceae bacterium]|nr:hypothetical protein [Gemmatimonadaceae bacterium]